MARKPTNQPPSAGMYPIYDAAVAFHDAAASFQPEGVYQQVKELEILPWVLLELAAGFAARAAACSPANAPLHPAIETTIGTLVDGVNSVVETSKQLYPAARSLHKAEIDRIENPRANEQRWDVANNHL